LDGLEGSIRLFADGTIKIQKLGEQEVIHNYQHQDINFSGDCVFATQRHFIDGLLSGNNFETNGSDYLRSLAVQEAIYRSAETRLPVEVNYGMND
jgi:hypothetical protein